jgi:hypothetical protein
MHWCNFLDEETGKALDPAGDGQPSGLYIPLRDDLANAIIATCKGAEPGLGAEACPANDPEVYDDSIMHPATKIYDPVWKTTTVIPDQEHQVEYNGVANTTHASMAVDGPKGDFYGHWNWAHQSMNAQWDHEGPYGENYTDDLTTEKSIGSHPPEPPALIQLDFLEAQDKKWVELPDCGLVVMKSSLLLISPMHLSPLAKLDQLCEHM